MTLDVPDLEAMAEVGRRLAASLLPGDVLSLQGNLGAGKTTLVREVARSLGIDVRLVSSPTFVYMNVYPNDRGPDVVHVDAYRLLGPEDTESLGWDRVMDGSSIIAIEWPERIEAILPARRWRISIEHADPGRVISIEPPCDRVLAD